MAKEKTEIYIATYERLIFRQISDREVCSFCSVCDRETIFLTPERTAVIFNTTVREIYRWIELSAIHYVEDTSGVIRVCAASRTPDNRKRGREIKPELFKGEKQ